MIQEIRIIAGAIFIVTLLTGPLFGFSTWVSFYNKKNEEKAYNIVCNVLFVILSVTAILWIVLGFFVEDYFYFLTKK